MDRIRNLATHAQPFITVRQLANYWQVSVRTIERHIAKGALPVTRVGPFSRLRISIEAARAYGQPDNG